MQEIIRKATDTDLQKIEEWLKLEQEQEEINFLCNWNLTKKIHEESRLYVLAQNNYPVAYAWDDLGILEVKNDCRKQGLGQKLANYIISEAKKRGEAVLLIECAPQSSIPFWRDKMGFIIYDRKKGYKIIERQLSTPDKGIPAKVKIDIFPERAIYSDNVPALEEHRQTAILLDNVYYLKDRVAIFNERGIYEGDVAVKISLEDKQVYFGKAKREEANLLGVQRASYAFFIDTINYPRG